MSSNLVPVGLLKPHPKNAEYFSRPPRDKYEEIKRSIAAEGIRDPLKVTPDYTVVAGHLRLEIAKELGLERVPVEIVDGDAEYLEYLLIADNEERRYCQDPVKKAKRAEFLRRYWGVREGRLARPGTPEGHFVPQAKTLADVAEAIGETEKNVKRLLKLNDLIPPLQDLVSSGRLAQTAAYSLAFLPPEEQQHLLDVLGESGVCGLSVREAQELRRQLDAERRRLAEAQARIRGLEERVAELQADSEDMEVLCSELERLREENERLKAQAAGAVERAVERVIYRPDPEQEAELERLRGEVAELRERLSRLSDRRGAEEQAAELDRLIREKQAQLERLEAERAMLDRELQGRRHAAALLRALDSLLIPLERRKEEVAELLRTCEIEANVRSRLRGYAELLRWYADRLEEAGRTVTVMDCR